MKAASVHTNATMIANGSQVFTKAATLKKRFICKNNFSFVSQT